MQDRRSNKTEPPKRSRRWRFNEQYLKAAVAVALWLSTTIWVIVASFLDAVSPENVAALRPILVIAVLLICGLTLLFARVLSPRRFQLFIELSVIPALALNVVLLQVTPATEAVLFNLILALIFAGYYLRRTALQLSLAAFIAVAISTLLTEPAKNTPHLESFLVVYIAAVLLTVSLMHIQNSERIDALAKLRRRGMTDPLTGLGNLRELRSAAARAISRSEQKRPGDEVLGLILLDIDNFKSANSRFGHIGGDYALRKIAEQMQRVAPPRSVVARVGGDEFAVLLYAESTARLVERSEIMRAAVRAASSIMEMPGVDVDAVTGVAVHPTDGRDLDELMGVAEQRLYKKKGAKRHLVPNLDRKQAASDERPPWLDDEPGHTETEIDSADVHPLDRLTGGNLPFLSTRTSFTRAGSLGWMTGCLILSVSLLMPDAYPDPLLTWWMVLIAAVVPIPFLLWINPEAGGVMHFLSDLGAYGSILVAIAATGGINSPAAPLLVVHVANQAWFWETRLLAFRLITPALIAASPLLYTSLTSSQADTISQLRIYATASVLFTLVLAMYVNRVMLARLHRIAKKLATRDPLTGITNRRAFNDYVQQQISDPNTSKFAIVMIDLDNFKRVNTEHGHQAGDAVLTAIAQSLAGVARLDDCVARIGGDEFAAVLPGVGVDGARTLAERLVGAVADSDEASRYKIGASAGFAIWPEHGETLDQLAFTADGALMTVKATGKGNARVAEIVPAVV